MKTFIKTLLVIATLAVAYQAKAAPKEMERMSMYQKQSFCGGFYQAVTIMKIGDFDNVVEMFNRGRFSNNYDAAYAEMIRHAKSASNMAGKSDQESWNKGGLLAGNFIQEGTMGKNGRLYVMECRSLPNITQKSGDEPSQDTFDVRNEGNQCIGVMMYYAETFGGGRDWRKPMRLRATYLQAWMLENNLYFSDRVANALSDLGGLSRSLDNQSERAELENTVNRCVKMYNRQINIEVNN